MIGEICDCCHYVDGHDLDHCPLVLEGKVKKMAGVPLKANAITVRVLQCTRCGQTHVLSKGPLGHHTFEPYHLMERFTDSHRSCQMKSGERPAFLILDRVEA